MKTNLNFNYLFVGVIPQPYIERRHIPNKIIKRIAAATTADANRLFFEWDHNIRYAEVIECFT